MFKEGKDNPNYKHGLSYKFNSEYKTWKRMIRRCTNKTDRDYQRYGGRGITVDPRWMSFEAFLNDMGIKNGDANTIERIDNNRGYTVENCKWATRSEQSLNRNIKPSGKYFGVTRRNPKNKNQKTRFISVISIYGINIHLKSFDTEEAAASLFDEAYENWWGIPSPNRAIYQ